MQDEACAWLSIQDRHFSAMTSRGNGGADRRSPCRKQRSSSGHGAPGASAIAELATDMRGSPLRCARIHYRWRRPQTPWMRMLSARAEDTYYGHWLGNFGWRIKGRGRGHCPQSAFCGMTAALSDSRRLQAPDSALYAAG